MTSLSTKNNSHKYGWRMDKFIIESSSFRYVIKDDLKLLFKLCRRFKTDAIAQTYATN